MLITCYNLKAVFGNTVPCLSLWQEGTIVSALAWVRIQVRTLSTARVAALGQHDDCTRQGLLSSTDLICPACSKGLLTRIAGFRIPRLILGLRLALFPLGWALALDWVAAPYVFAIGAIALITAATLRNHKTVRNYLLGLYIVVSLLVGLAWLSRIPDPIIIMTLVLFGLAAAASVVFPFGALKSVWQASLVSQLLVLLWIPFLVLMANLLGAASFNLAASVLLGAMTASLVLTASPQTIPHAFRKDLPIQTRYLPRLDRLFSVPSPPEPIDLQRHHRLLRAPLQVGNAGMRLTHWMLTLLTLAANASVRAIVNFADGCIRLLHRLALRAREIFLSYLRFGRWLRRLAARSVTSYVRVVLLPLIFASLSILAVAIFSETLVSYVGLGQGWALAGWGRVGAMILEIGIASGFAIAAISVMFRNREKVIDSLLNYLPDLGVVSIAFFAAASWTFIGGPRVLREVPGLPVDIHAFLSDSPYDPGPTAALATSFVVLAIGLGIILNRLMPERISPRALYETVRADVSPARSPTGKQ